MAAWGYEFYLLVLKVSLTRSLRSLVIHLDNRVWRPRDFSGMCGK